MNTLSTTAIRTAAGGAVRRHAAPRAPVWGRREIFAAEAAYVLFLLLVFIGVAPFMQPSDALGSAAADAGAGDIVRQITYLGAFGFIAAMSVLRHGRRALRSVSPLFALLLAWCLLSAAWSAEPDVTFRRAVLVTIVACSALMSVDLVGTERSLQLLRYVLGGAILICWVSLPLIPQARHLANDYEPGVAGDWRGLYAHKNIAGAVCANATMLFLYWASKHRSRIDFVFALLAFGFLMGTRSKSSLGLLPIALLAGVVFRFASRNKHDRQVVAVACCLLGFLVLAGLVAYWDTIALAFQDPDLFTGRAAIWQAEIAYIGDHPLLGSGFGSFAYTGGSSPIADYVNASWVGAVASGHNSYLEILVTLGIPGFCMAMYWQIVQPSLWFMERNRIDPALKGYLISLFAFFVLHNFMESNILKTDAPEWLLFLLATAMFKSARERAMQRAS